MSKEHQPPYFYYNFQFDKNRSVRIDLHLDADTLTYRAPTIVNAPEWTHLDFEKCNNCTLKSEENECCPIALNLVDILPRFRNYVSYDRVQVTVETRERTYSKSASVQQGLGSLLGIIMVTSGCPIMDVLRPMVRFHLPFASIDETIFRSASSWLLGQYFRVQHDLKPDWDMVGLLKAYEEIQILNVGMTNRLRNISETDANANAVIVLDVFAKELPYSIFDGLKKLEYLYGSYLKK